MGFLLYTMIMAIIRPTVLNINKPLGWTSRDVLNKLQRLYNFKKFGHAGTLDPLATGVLLVLVSKETKNQQYYMSLPKEYRVRIFFGIDSPTLDLEGPLSTKPEKIAIDKTKIENYLKEHLGEQEQKVPLYSAVKVKGKTLYKSARKGEVIESIPTKKVVLHNYKIEDFKDNLKPFNKSSLEELQEYKDKLDFLSEHLPYVDIWLKTGKGYYVRSLARDLGKYLGTKGVVGKLERTAVGDFRIEDSLTMEYFESRPDLV